MQCIGSKDSVTCWSIVYIHYLRGIAACSHLSKARSLYQVCKRQAINSSALWVIG